MFRFILVVLLFSQPAFANQVGNERTECINYIDLNKLESEQLVLVGESVQVDTIQVCNFNAKRRYLSFKTIVGDSICRVEQRALEFFEGFLVYKNEPAGYHYAIGKQDGCPNMNEFMELTNLSKSLNANRVTILLNEFQERLVDKDSESYEKYFDLSFWNKYMDSGYSNFIKSSNAASEIRITDVSRYLLSNDESIHLISILIANTSWSLVAFISNDSIMIKSVSMDI